MNHFQYWQLREWQLQLAESIPLFRSSPLGIFYGVLGALGQAGGLILAKFAFTDGELNGFVAAFIRLSSAVLIFFPVVLLIKNSSALGKKPVSPH